MSDTTTMFHWACTECLACHCGGEQAFVLSTAREHARAHSHTVHGKVSEVTWVNGRPNPRVLREGLITPANATGH